MIRLNVGLSTQTVRLFTEPTGSGRIGSILVREESVREEICRFAHHLQFSGCDDVDDESYSNKYKRHCVSGETESIFGIIVDSLLGYHVAMSETEMDRQKMKGSPNDRHSQAVVDNSVSFLEM